jgi:hypothetical protein
MSIFQPICENSWVRKAMLSALLMAMGHSLIGALGLAFLSSKGTTSI